MPWEQWWAAVEADEERDLGEDVEGYFVHPVRDPPVMAGNGTIGLELVEQLDDIDAVLIPWGGGGLTTGIASALHALTPRHEGLHLRARDRRACDRGARERRRARPGRLHAVVRRRRRLGRPPAEDVGAREAARHRRRSPITLEDAAATVRLLLERARIVAEGAAALPVAAALAGRAGAAASSASSPAGTSTRARLAAILDGRVPD